MCILYWEENVSGKGQARLGILAAKKSSRPPADFDAYLLREKYKGNIKQPITDAFLWSRESSAPIRQPLCYT